MKKETDIKAWIKKIQDSKDLDVDLSIDEDLSIALMNLISLEEHFYFSAMKTNNQKYLDMLNSTRELRKILLKRIVKDPDGEEWCISKHLLAASMRLIEVGTKELAKNNKEEANRLFKYAFDLYSLFFAINMKLVGVKELMQNPETKNTMNIMGKFSAAISKILDCCRE